MKSIIVFLLLAFLFISCTKNDTLFVKVNSASSHVNFKNQLTPTTDLNILNYLYYYNGAGVSAADFNNDGDYNDPGENTPVGSTVTNGLGNYQFDNLEAGQYQVHFELPANHVYTSQNIGSESIDSDADANTGITELFQLGIGECNNDIDAGIYELDDKINIGNLAELSEQILSIWSLI